MNQSRHHTYNFTRTYELQTNAKSQIYNNHTVKQTPTILAGSYHLTHITNSQCNNINVIMTFSFREVLNFAPTADCRATNQDKRHTDNTHDLVDFFNFCSIWRVIGHHIVRLLRIFFRSFTLLLLRCRSKHFRVDGFGLLALGVQTLLVSSGMLQKYLRNDEKITHGFNIVPVCCEVVPFLEGISIISFTVFF